MEDRSPDNKDTRPNVAGPPSEAVIDQIVSIVKDNETESDDSIAATVMNAMRKERIELEPRAVYEIIAEVRTGA